MKVIDDLERDPEFESLRDTPGIFKRAAIGYVTDPQGFLRKHMRGEAKLEYHVNSSIPALSEISPGTEP